MGGKKKKGGKKGKKKGGGEFALNTEEENQVLYVMQSALQARLVDENVAANQAKQSENEKRFRELNLERKVAE